MNQNILNKMENNITNEAIYAISKDPIDTSPKDSIEASPKDPIDTIPKNMIDTKTQCQQMYYQNDNLNIFYTPDSYFIIYETIKTIHNGQEQNVNKPITEIHYDMTNIDYKNVHEMFDSKEYDIVINKYYLNMLNVCVFSHNDCWWFVYNNSIFKSNNDNSKILDNDMHIPQQNNDSKTLDKNDVKIDSKLLNIFKKQFNVENFDDVKLNKNYVYHFVVKYGNTFKTHPNAEYIAPMYLSSICNKLYAICNNEKTLLKTDDETINEYLKNLNINEEKKYYFSCYDELELSLDSIGSNDVLNKVLSCGGYLLKITNKSKTQISYFILKTEIYKYVYDMLPKHKNKYIGYLELYQKNKLGDVLSFLHKYPASVIKRTNASFKILSREILNIYHLTRQKQNTSMYDALPSNYKKILYTLHNIYVSKKYGDINMLNELQNNDLLKERTSISVDIVYALIKSFHIDDLVKLFMNRKIMWEMNNENNLFEKILIDNIDIITQIQLMYL